MQGFGLQYCGVGKRSCFYLTFDLCFRHGLLSRCSLTTTATPQPSSCLSLMGHPLHRC